MSEKQRPECAACPRPVCNSVAWEEGPANCPTKNYPEALEKAREKLFSPQWREFFYQSCIQEGQGYTRVPFAPKGPSPLLSRVEELIAFSRKMGYRRLGVAFCGGVQNEARLLSEILENQGFEVTSVCCKCGSIPKEEIGVKDEEKITPGKFEATCNPIGQAEILNEKNVDLSIMVCLCLGHDTMFLKNINTPVTVFAVKDRLFGHNPVVALYQSKEYYRRLLSKDLFA